MTSHAPWSNSWNQAHSKPSGESSHLSTTKNRGILSGRQKVCSWSMSSMNYICTSQATLNRNNMGYVCKIWNVLKIWVRTGKPSISLSSNFPKWTAARTEENGLSSYTAVLKKMIIHNCVVEILFDSSTLHMMGRFVLIYIQAISKNWMKVQEHVI